MELQPRTQAKLTRGLKEMGLFQSMDLLAWTWSYQVA